MASSLGAIRSELVSAVLQSRRDFVKLGGSAALVLAGSRVVATAVEGNRVGGLRDRVRGLLVGAMIGDALGGPVEFQDPERVRGLPNPPKTWAPGERLNDAACEAALRRLHLRSYQDLRPEPEPFAHWGVNAPPGTVTDDTRHKLVLLRAWRESRRRGRSAATVEDLAQAYLDWPGTGKQASRLEWKGLCHDWLREWQLGAAWILGEHDLDRALPPERMWGGLPTCCGQMTLPPLAARFPGRPGDAYRAAFELGFFDNGFAKDLNPALIAGLAEALVAPCSVEARHEGWRRILDVMRATDPFRYGAVPWVTRPVERWLGLALEAAREAEGQPALLFKRLEAEFRQTIKWEAQVPFVVAFACLALADYRPLVALQLSIEWGHDTDSYAALVGAFVGALHGASVFRESLCRPVVDCLRKDYGEELEDWVSVAIGSPMAAANGE